MLWVDVNCPVLTKLTHSKFSNLLRINDMAVRPSMKRLDVSMTLQ